MPGVRAGVRQLTRSGQLEPDEIVAGHHEIYQRQHFGELDEQQTRAGVDDLVARLA